MSLPTGEKIKVYVSGDTVAFKNGHLHDVKRSNRMLKLSGKRVDLDGFETICRDLLIELKAVAVVAIDDRAVAYLIGSQQLFNKQKFIEQLKIALPDVYLCLQALVWIQELPKLATSGKVDYKKLATQAYFDQQDKNQITELAFADQISPRFALEKALAEIWRAELQWSATAEFSVHASFAELGGSSFNLRRLLNRIQRENGLNENVWPDAFKNPAHITLAKLTEFILQHWLVVKLKEGESTQKHPSIYFIHSASGNPEIDYKDTLLRHMPKTAATIFGIKADLMLVTSIEELAAHYIAAIKSQQPYGPYFLVGWSSGGLIAYEMAQQLTNQGEVVFLNMIDSLHPGCRDRINQLLKTPENQQKLERLLQNELPRKIIEASANEQYLLSKAENHFQAWLAGSEVDIELDQQACKLMLLEARRENLVLTKQLNAASRALLFVQWHQGKLPEEIKIKLQNNIIDTALANDITLIDVVSKWLNNKLIDLCEGKYKRNTDNEFREAFEELLLQWQQNYFLFDTP